MFNTIRRFWNELRDGFWFLPFLLLAAHVGAAILLISTGLGENRPWMAQWPKLFGAGAEGARGMLSTIAGSMMTVVGVTLSMTVVTLALASSQYSSRILRNFIRDRITQFVLGLFAGIYCYCLIVLRTIRGGDEGAYVPSLAVMFAVLLAVAAIVVLIYFIHHIATSIQAANIIASVADDTVAAIDRLYPEEIPAPHPDDHSARRELPATWFMVTATIDGYIQRVDFRQLQNLAAERDTLVRMERRIGEFVVKGTPLFSVAGNVEEKAAFIAAAHGMIDIGRHRTVEQDVGFGIRQLVDIALRALSPGINDTTTAVMCLDYLTAILMRLAVRPALQADYSAYEFDRVTDPHAQNFTGFVQDALDQIREAGRGNSAVLERMLDSVSGISAATRNGANRDVLLDELTLLEESIRDSVESSRDRERLMSAASAVRLGAI